MESESRERRDYPYVPLPSVFDEEQQREEITTITPKSGISVPAIILGIFYYVVRFDCLFEVSSLIVIIPITKRKFGVIMPLFNSLLFRVKLDVKRSRKGDPHINSKGYGYPLTATWIQLVGVNILLLAYNIISWRWKRRDGVQRSWIFGEGFFWKWFVPF